MIHSKGKLLLRSTALIALLVAALGILSVLVVHADPFDTTGTIVIKKQTEPPGGAGFEFTDDIPGGPVPFWYLNDGGQQEFTNAGLFSSKRRLQKVSTCAVKIKQRS